jgi:predicted amidophosphoribosyltransferase
MRHRGVTRDNDGYPRFCPECGRKFQSRSQHLEFWRRWPAIKRIW